MEIKIWGTAEDGTYKRKRRNVNDFAQLMEQGKLNDNQKLYSCETIQNSLIIENFIHFIL